MITRRAKAERRCENCDEPLTPATVDVYRKRAKRHVLFERVPALVCRACGHRLFEADAIEMMEERLNQKNGQRRTASLLVYNAR